MVEPKSGTLCFAVTGMYGYGTMAAGFWAANQVIPNRASFTDSWYAYQWQDTDKVPGPSLSDTWTLIQSGD